MRKILSILLLLMVLGGCTKQEKQKFNTIFYDTFDTQVQYLEYADNKKEFDKNAKFVESEYKRLHKLYDNYRSYEGIINVKTLNENAGKKLLKVDKDLFNLIKFSKENYDKTLGKVNIAMGNVLTIWHDIREENVGKEDDRKTIIPKKEDLIKANKYSDINEVVLDEKNMTVFIKNSNTSIDFGAVAKGYATELVAKKLESKGVKNASINAGGNVRTIGLPGDGRKEWKIGLQNPDVNNKKSIKILNINGSKSIVTSGDYQRFFMHNGKRYHHIINPKTLQPETIYRAVSVVTDDSGLADMLSTALYLSTKEEAKKILENYKDVEIGIVWVDDKEATNTENMNKIINKEN
ncbi:FAD:protein FMN transferase [Helcococcus ovis]|uniref:FAD:protein FMN transferase n=1 Tax=Helcococcus ovis TaxID=72026 RepID=UPI00106F2C88|nr:FAD:protein FMN transferase [Helcococcus ovis]TFF68584.1 FAD:protein FMN transferase [Helcococcus ovis]WNZ01311.1 FAD:protein FMN transferase [Helcococcus ovis]